MASMDMESLRPRVESLLGQFTLLMDRWDEWLHETHSTYLSGDYPKLELSHQAGLLIVSQLRDALRERQQFLDEVRLEGLAVNDLRDVQKYYDHSRDAELRIQRLSHRLQGLRQHSLALWILAFQCLEHTSQVLQVLATGEPQESTYGTSEFDSIGGGRLVNQAA